MAFQLFCDIIYLISIDRLPEEHYRTPSQHIKLGRTLIDVFHFDMDGTAEQVDSKEQAAAALLIEKGFPEIARTILEHAEWQEALLSREEIAALENTFLPKDAPAVPSVSPLDGESAPSLDDTSKAEPEKIEDPTHQESLVPPEATTSTTDYEDSISEGRISTKRAERMLLTSPGSLRLRAAAMGIKPVKIGTKECYPETAIYQMLTRLIDDTRAEINVAEDRLNGLKKARESLLVEKESGEQKQRARSLVEVNRDISYCKRTLARLTLRLNRLEA